MECLRQEADGTLSLLVRVQPKASANRVSGLHGDALKICITAPPVDGKANAALTRFLADFFGLRRSAVNLQSGGGSRDKRFLLSGISLTDAQKTISRSMA